MLCIHFVKALETSFELQHSALDDDAEIVALMLIYSKAFTMFFKRILLTDFIEIGQKT